jgi:citronellol/citronellal dehydrogenase
VEFKFGGEEALRRSRTVEIMADAAYEIITRRSRTCTGQFFIDDEVLRESGVSDLARYAVDSSERLMPDLFVDEDTVA